MVCLVLNHNISTEEEVYIAIFRGLGIWDGERDGGMVGVSVARW